MTELDTVIDMFANIKSDTNWNLDEPMLWGYFFTDAKQEKLHLLIPVLENQGYRAVDIHAAELDEDADEDEQDDEYFILHVEKEEIHSPNSLHERNAQLHALAESHGVDSYDGMDVGPIV